MKEWYKDFIGVYENVIPKEVCLDIISYFEDNLSHTQTREQHDPGLNFGLMEDRFLFYNINQNPNPNQNLQKLHSFLLNNLFSVYKKKYGSLEYIPNIGLTDIKIQKTSLAEGYHVWHYENNHVDSSNNNRVLAYTLYLNDVKEGGETEFLYQSLRVKPTVGTVCIFPSYFTHTHRGNPPLSGEKYIVTGWYSAHIT